MCTALELIQTFNNPKIIDAPDSSFRSVIFTVTENYAKHTFQAPCSCFKSGLTIDLVLFKTINVSID